MALLNILHYPDERLHTVARPVDVVDDALRRLIDDMAETMYAAHGIGLAATQIDCHRRLVVIDLSEEHDDLLVLINPVITRKAGETVYEEGCLSVPGIYDGVERAERVKVRALDAQGTAREIEADGLLAVCIQHEMDHLMGKVFVEYLSPLKRNRIKTKLIKQQKEAAKA